ncbi:MAG: hypothetical protein H0V97_06060, partial [Actinobacteria bacterium]|nr:hypothetical protein [Actinomycetota bacterium]
MRRSRGLLVAVAILGSLVVVTAGAASGQSGQTTQGTRKADSVPLSGVAAFRDQNFGTRITECPQAGLPAGEPDPLDLRRVD